MLTSLMFITALFFTYSCGEKLKAYIIVDGLGLTYDGIKYNLYCSNGYINQEYKHILTFVLRTIQIVNNRTYITTKITSKANSVKTDKFPL